LKENEVFLISLGASIAGYLEIIVIGPAIGALSGALVAIGLKLRVQGIVHNAFLGLIGFVVTLIVYNEVATSRSHYPLTVAGLIAIIPPALHQLFRFRCLSSGAQ
jgi:uncharacterized membrane protein YeaQ/YmgE (transglycosylase-associated protein family)